MPNELSTLSLAFASITKSAKEDGSPFYFARKYLDFLANKYSLDIEYKPLSSEPEFQTAKPFDHRRLAAVYVKGQSTP